MVNIVKLDYGDWGSYNNPENNERRVELPVAFWFIKNYPDNLIEIGEVTAFYIDPVHTVYDLRNEKESTIVKDAIEVDYTEKNVLSISTIEHVGTSDYGYCAEENKAWNLLQKIKNESKNYMISFPIGYNRPFEEVLIQRNERLIVMERDSLNRWKMVRNIYLSNFEYNAPYSEGNAVGFLTNLDIEFTFGE